MKSNLSYDQMARKHTKTKLRFHLNFITLIPKLIYTYIHCRCVQYVHRASCFQMIGSMIPIKNDSAEQSNFSFDLVRNWEGSYCVVDWIPSKETEFHLAIYKVHSPSSIRTVS